MSTISLAGKVALITGSSSGLGKAIAERYAALGADIVVHYAKSKAGAEEVVRTITEQGRRAVAVQADISKVADIERLFTEARHRGGQCRHGAGRNPGDRLHRSAV
jgi:3-oxoacyl-[acyl-carrier protein] reductase